MQREAQYNLDGKVAKISALSSNNLHKYEYLASDDLDLKLSTVEQARFKYSLLVKIFNKGLKEEDKKERLLKRLKNIEGKTEELLKAVKTNTTSKIDLHDEDLIPDVIRLIKEIKSIEENVGYDKLSFTGDNKNVYGLESFKKLEKLIKEIPSKSMAIDEAKMKQNKFARGSK